ncbi:MAG: hypothetical protein OEX07_04585 [Gammaproteobacteria bacterium]|nr:hypothetical protein [Gammaproteobacteria bacterium]
MSLIFNSNRIVEKGYKQKQYFSDKPVTTLKVKCFACLLVVMLFLFGMNIYQTISQVSVVNTFF